MGKTTTTTTTTTTTKGRSLAAAATEKVIYNPIKYATKKYYKGSKKLFNKTKDNVHGAHEVTIIVVLLIIFGGAALLWLISLVYIGVVDLTFTSIVDIFSGTNEEIDEETEEGSVGETILYLVIYLIVTTLTLRLIKQSGNDTPSIRSFVTLSFLVGLVYMYDKFKKIRIVYYILFILAISRLVYAIIPRKDDEGSYRGGSILKNMFGRVGSVFMEDLRNANTREEKVAIVFNFMGYYLTLFMIIHVLWIILVYTSPTMNYNLKLTPPKDCSLPWLYYGVYPAEDYDVMDDINKYMFDITKWLPDDAKDNPDFTCQPCPTNMTPLGTHGTIRTSCRPCTDDEEWMSIEDIKQKRAQGVLNADEKRLIGNDGMTVEEAMLSNNSYKTFSNDHGNNFDQIKRETGMCFPKDAGYGPWGSGNVCDSYNDCMTQGQAYIELRWPKEESLGNHRVYPGQRIEIRDLDTPIAFDIPHNIIDPTISDNCDLTDTDSINHIYEDHNKYNNPICDVTSLEPGDAHIQPLSVPNENNDYCHLRIPVDHQPLPNNDPLRDIPIQYKVIRHGGNSSNTGPPCNSSNRIAQDYLISGGALPNPTDINHNNAPSGLSSRYVDRTGNSSRTDDLDSMSLRDLRNKARSMDISASLIQRATDRSLTATSPPTTALIQLIRSKQSPTTVANDWRNIYEVMYDTCYQKGDLNSTGQCYMDNSICQTTTKTPLPLVDLLAPSPILTIGEASDLGCRNIAIVDTCISENTTCNALDVDVNGNIIDAPGICKYATWSSTGWNLLDGSSNSDSDLRCFPTPTMREMGTVFHATGYTISNPNMVQYNENIFRDPNYFESMCKKIPRFPESSPTPQPSIFEYRIISRPACTGSTATGTGSVTDPDDPSVPGTPDSIPDALNRPNSNIIARIEKYWDNWSPDTSSIPPPADVIYGQDNIFNSISLP